ncbi:hypothetical protein BKA57DRAFT_4367 [Linnemannia elongata]|nr:hypothetical protein BKA57DRAFT_4367 [Linnemannia elongata]
MVDCKSENKVKVVEMKSGCTVQQHKVVCYLSIYTQPSATIFPQRPPSYSSKRTTVPCCCSLLFIVPASKCFERGNLLFFHFLLHLTIFCLCLSLSSLLSFSLFPFVVLIFVPFCFFTIDASSSVLPPFLPSLLPSTLPSTLSLTTPSFPTSNLPHPILQRQQQTTNCPPSLSPS